MIEYGFMKNAILASILISILCPSVGTFLVLKRYSMMGDTLSHASFAGVAIGITFGFNPILCSFIFTSICALLIEMLRKHFENYAELILIIILTLSVGIAITLISSGKTHANVNAFLFGSILTVSKTDLYTILTISVISISLLFLLYDKLLYITFDEESAKIAGIHANLINYIFALLVGATISVSISIIGILVISSMIAIPTATALQLEKGFKPTLIYSIIFGFIDMIVGLLASYYINCAPGGTIALTSILILLIVILVKKIKRL